VEVCGGWADLQSRKDTLTLRIVNVSWSAAGKRLSKDSRSVPIRTKRGK
jgi:hypothetical protein